MFLVANSCVSTSPLEVSFLTTVTVAMFSPSTNASGILLEMR